MEHMITTETIEAFRYYLQKEERALNTIEKYMYNVKLFYEWSQGRSISKEIVSEWKNHLSQVGYSAVTVNIALAAVHSFFDFVDWKECRVKYLKVQRQVFRDNSKELKKEEYTRLVNCANKKGKTRLALIIETICATGIRVSELKYITVEAIQKRRTDIALKGKIRTILFPNKLIQKLKQYIKKQKITSGEIFITATKKGISRKQIWSEMKQLCKDAGVEESKVYPHNLRHLFARVFYKASKDIVRLADVLGHSSIETTRIYLMTTGEEYARQLEELRFVL